MTDIELEYEDDDWINKIEEEDNLYNDFYYEKNEHVRIYCIYTSNNEIQHIKKDIFLLDNQKITKEKLLYILKSNKTFKKHKYSLSSIHKYNIDLRPKDVLLYLKNPSKFHFFEKTSIKDIVWKDSISLFQDLNCLYIIYVEKNKKKFSCTKKMLRNKKKHNKTKKSH